MNRQLILKKLTASDLTLFEYHFRRNPAGNQKAINLNANVLVSTLFPRLPVLALEREGRFPLDLFIFGPAAAGELNLQRKVIKVGSAYKNWRLDGEMIFNPPEQSDRFNCLTPNDLALIEFTGDEFPVSARMVLIAAQSELDSALHGNLIPFVDRMNVLPFDQLKQIVDSTDLLVDHPVHELLLEEGLEQAALGGNEGTERLYNLRPGRRMSRRELTEARIQAEAVGRLGEERVALYLENLRNQSLIEGFEWVSDINAVAPFDFLVRHNNGDTERVDVKSTMGESTRTIHASWSEVMQMADPGVPYRIYRISELSESSAILQISQPVNELAQRIVGSVSNLPPGVVPDSFSLQIDTLSLGSADAIGESFEDGA